jgi:hypothetical protein
LRSKPSKKVVVVVTVIAVVVIAFLLFGSGPETPLIEIQFAGLTNRLGDKRNSLAVYVLTNVSGAPLHVSVLREVKTGGSWPVYGPDLRRSPYTLSNLPPHQSATHQVAMPDYGTTWRVSFAYREASTKWDKMREKCAGFLYRHKLQRTARFIWPGKEDREIVMPEMESLPPSWSHDGVRPPQPQ